MPFGSWKIYLVVVVGVLVFVALTNVLLP